MEECHGIYYRFDSYCKKVLKNELINYSKIAQRIKKYETSFSDLSIGAACTLYHDIDTYFKTKFYINGKYIYINDIDLAGALTDLEESKRKIILLAYIFDMADREISEHLNLPRSTVNYRRLKALKELKHFMEELV